MLAGQVAGPSKELREQDEEAHSNGRQLRVSSADEERHSDMMRGSSNNHHGGMFKDKLIEVLKTTLDVLHNEHLKCCQVQEEEFRRRLLELGHVQAAHDLPMRRAASSQEEEGQHEESAAKEDNRQEHGKQKEERFQEATPPLPQQNSRTLRGFTLLSEWSTDAEVEALEEEDPMTQLTYYRGLDMFLDQARSKPTAQAQTMSLLTASRLVTLPTSRGRIAWDLLASLFLLYDLIIIPMGVFDLPSDGVFLAAAVAGMLYWTVDLFSNFFVGFPLGDGEIELRMGKIAHHYFITWFFLDLLLVGIEWFTYGPALFSNDNSETGALDSFGLLRVVRMARFVRLLRILRVLRLCKLLSIFQTLQGFIGLESTAIALNIFKNVLVIGFINHAVACLWFAIGKADTENGWLTIVGRPNDGWLSDYLLSMYWSVANFTPGSSGISSRSRGELAFTVLCLFFALVVASIFVSSTTSMISRLMGIQSAQNHQVWVLKGFLFQHQVPVELRERVLRYVRTALGNQGHLIRKGEVQLLTMLSEPLREEIQLNLHYAKVKYHMLFKLLYQASPPLMKRITVDAMTEVILSVGDTLFSVGEDMDTMTFVDLGVLRYAAVSTPAQALDSVRSIASMSESVQENVLALLISSGEHFCEACLWTKWRCRGTMRSDANCHLVSLNSGIFRSLVKRNTLVSGMVVDYAKAFVEALNARDAEGRSPLTDVHSDLLGEGYALTSVVSHAKHWLDGSTWL